MLLRSSGRTNGLPDSSKTVQLHENASSDSMATEILELQAILEDLDLYNYFNDLVEHGFDTWDNLTNITEIDMAGLGIKLGHRRKLQREIARRQGQHSNAPLSDVLAPSLETNEQGSEANGHIQELRTKRRYRRRPPRDPNAPTRPDTAYVAYSKAQREDSEVANLSFVEIAKLVGDRWANLASDTKDIWNQSADAEKEEYESAVADYRQTDAYQEYRDKIQSKLPSKERRESNVSRDESLSQTSSSEPKSAACSSTAGDTMSKSPRSVLTTAQQTRSKLGQSSSTTYSSKTDTINSSYSTEMSPSRQDSSTDTFVSSLDESNHNVPIIDSILEMISQEEVPGSEHPSTQISLCDLSYNLQHLTLSKSFHVQNINPFNLQPRSVIEPILESFLQQTNTIYYLIDPADLRTYLDSVLDPKFEVPNLTLSVVCFCIAIGYQNFFTETPDMAIMWYENGRRYFDDSDWNLDPVVMQILALISMFHMAQRPSTSSHHLNAAIRIGEAINLHRAMEEVNHSGGSENVKWLDIWITIMDMNQVLVLGSAENNLIIRALPISLEAMHGKSSFTSYRGPRKLEGSQYRFVRAQSSITTCAFGDLFDILGCIQQQLGQNNKAMPQPWEASIFMQQLETWLQSLPDELLLPAISGSQRIDQGLLKKTIIHASDRGKFELLHLYSLYFGVINLLMSSSLQQIATMSSDQSTFMSEHDEGNAYICLYSASRLIDLCAAYYNVSPFPVFAWLPTSILFNSALICVLGILWQRQLLASGTTSSQEWQDRSNHSLNDALYILEYCGIHNEQCQRHFLVLQLVFVWLQKNGNPEPTDSCGLPTTLETII